MRRVLLFAITAVLFSPAGAAAAQVGNTHVGSSTDQFSNNLKRVNRYSFTTGGTVSSLSIYLQPGSAIGSQKIKGAIYTDANGAPSLLMGATNEFAYSGSTAGWYTLTFPTPTAVPAGYAWIGVITGGTSHVAGFRYDSVPSSRDKNTNTYSSGPSSPFGAYTTDSEEMSLYANFTPKAETQAEREAREKTEREQREREQREKEERERIEKEKEAAGADQGHPFYEINASSEWDQFSGEEAFIKAHAQAFVVHPTFGDRYVKYGLPVIGYHDYYTEYTNAGKPLCEKTNRESFVAKVRRDISVGYKGTFLDDANFAGGNIPGSRECLAELIEELRSAIGPSGILDLNAQYLNLKGIMEDPYVKRALAVTSIIHKEFGVAPTSGIGSVAAFEAFLSWVAGLHAKGIHLVMGQDYHYKEVRWDLFSYATALLLNDGQDGVSGGGWDGLPSNWWPVFDTDLGAALGPATHVGGLWQRSFVGGKVYVNAPGASLVTVEGHTLNGGEGLIT